MTNFPASPLIPILSEDHRLIERALTGLARWCSHLERGGAFDAAVGRAFVEFFRTFADREHHAREEGTLFPWLEARGFSRHAGPIAVMLAEHDEGRTLLATLEREIEASQAGAGHARSRSGLLQAAERYVALLSEHIAKEDNVLFPLADRLGGTGNACMLESCDPHVARRQHEPWVEVIEAASAAWASAGAHPSVARP
jgi:hemerythrin-like domain-containing protein